MASQPNLRHAGCIGGYVMYSSWWAELRNGFKGSAELGLEGPAKKTRVLEKSRSYIGASPATSMFKAILNGFIILVFHINCWGFLSLPSFPRQQNVTKRLILEIVFPFPNIKFSGYSWTYCMNVREPLSAEVEKIASGWMTLINVPLFF